MPRGDGPGACHLPAARRVVGAASVAVPLRRRALGRVTLAAADLEPAPRALPRLVAPFHRGRAPQAALDVRLWWDVPTGDGSHAHAADRTNVPGRDSGAAARRPSVNPSPGAPRRARAGGRRSRSASAVHRRCTWNPLSSFTGEYNAARGEPDTARGTIGAAARGDVAEWLGRGLQSLVQRFESARRLDRCLSPGKMRGAFPVL